MDHRWPWAGVTAGLALIAAWFAATKTTLFLAYGTPSTGIRTLSQVQGLCDSTTGLFARTLSASGAANCGAVDHTAMLWNAAGFAGLLIILASTAVLAYRVIQQRPAQA